MFREWYGSSPFTGLFMRSISVRLDSYNLDMFAVNHAGVEEFHESSTRTRYAASEN